MASLATRRVLAAAACRRPMTAFVVMPAAATRCMSTRTPSPAFTAAVTAVQQLPAAPGNDVKLQMYALFKQATVGPNTTSKPGMFDIVAKAKWTAWSELGQMKPEEAEAKYIDICKSLGARVDGGGGSGKAAAPAPAAAQVSGGAGGASGSAAGGEEVVVTTTPSGVRTIRINRPDKRNAITFDMYHRLVAELKAAGEDGSVKVTVLTGTGPFFCSGNDLSNFATMPPGGPAELAARGEATLKAFVHAFIHHPKVLIAAVNGPAVGISVTTLPLCDLVYASHKATLHAPLVALGQCPEGCSSYTFPRILGTARANDLLLLGRKITATEGQAWGLVNEVFEEGEFASKVAAQAETLASLPPQSLRISKAMMRARGFPLADLDAANEAECATIKDRWLSEECMTAIMKFMSSKAGKR